MRKDPELVFQDTFKDLRFFFEKDAPKYDDIKREVFDRFLLSYEGYDIIEVICREGGVWAAYDRIIDQRDNDWDDNFKAYFDAVIYAANKYSLSEDWPLVERKRAKSFYQYLLISRDRLL